jgi:hypothetical protein
MLRENCLPIVVQSLDVLIIFQGAVEESERKAYNINFAFFYITGYTCI